MINDKARALGVVYLFLRDDDHFLKLGPENVPDPSDCSDASGIVYFANYVLEIITSIEQEARCQSSILLSFLYGTSISKSDAG